MRERVEEEFKELQDYICGRLERLDGIGKFKQDKWERPGGGGGRTRVLEEGSIIEKGGVNFSAVHGNLSPNMAKALKIDADEFFGTGVSIVLHPKSPMVPIIHMNVRYFEAVKGDKKFSWFGGGIDLTPHYVDTELAKRFHIGLKNVCDDFADWAYPKYKEWADNYFFLPHRDETRGVGGVFFDRLQAEGELSIEAIRDFVMKLGSSFPDLYEEQVIATKGLPFGEQELDWQRLRRGRYVEFNLLWDRGTKFGVETNGRTESILMSLPKTAGWDYNYIPGKGTPEEATLNYLKKGVDFLKL